MSIKLTYEIACIGSPFTIVTKLCKVEGWNYERQGVSRVFTVTKTYPTHFEAQKGKDAFFKRYSIIKTSVMGIRPCTIEEK